MSTHTHAQASTNTACNAYNRGYSGQTRDPLPGEPPNAAPPATDPWLAGHLDAWLASRDAPRGVDLADARSRILEYCTTHPAEAHRMSYPEILRAATVEAGAAQGST